MFRSLCPSAPVIRDTAGRPGRSHQFDSSWRVVPRTARFCAATSNAPSSSGRRTTASRLLANTELVTVAIAMLLGFMEPNSFARVGTSRTKTI